MNKYCWTWMLGWSFVAAFGLAISITALPGGALVVLAIFGAGTGLVAHTISTAGGGSPGADRKLSGLVPAAARRAVIGACIVLALVGMGSFIGGLALLLGVLAAITSPQLLRYLAGIVSRRSAPATPALWDKDPGSPSAPGGHVSETQLRYSVQELSYEDLCRTWRTTYLPVKVAADAASLGTLSALRGACLDELERRDPYAFKAWLDSGPQASGTPERFLNKRED